MGYSPGVRVQVDVKAETMARARLLGHIARDIVAAAGVPSYALDDIVRGLQEQVLSAVRVIFADAKSNSIGFLAVEVDWDQYKINLQDNTKAFTSEVNPDSPPVVQLSQQLTNAAAYIHEVITQLRPAWSETYYIPRSGKLEEMRRLLGTVQATPEELAKLSAAEAGARRRLGTPSQFVGMRIVDGNFSELGVTFAVLAEETERKP
jgi:hypothetical protein